MKKLWQGLLSLIITFGLVATAWATVTTYQYTDSATNSFNIQLFQCINTPVYCTAMVIEDSSGNEKFTSGNPGTITGAVTNAGTFAVQDATVEGAISSSVMQSNTKQVNGVTTLAGAGAVGTGSQRVAVGQDTTTIAGSAPGTAGSASSNVVTVQGVSSMTPVLVTPSAAADPCMSAAKTNFALASSSGNVQVVAGSSSKKVYICSISVIAAGSAVINFIEGTGGACTTANEAAVIGSTTAASGMSVPANGGFTLGNGGGTVAVTATAANGICVLQSGTTALAGNVTYVQQ